MFDITPQEVVRNHQLFSEVYLREWTATPSQRDAAHAARQTVAEWRREYADLSAEQNAAAFIKQTLSALGVSYAARTNPNSNHSWTLFSDADKHCATGLCLWVGDSDLGRAIKGQHHQQRLISELRRANLGWGILTNGAQWRLCCAKISAPYEAFLEIDADALLLQANQTEFAVFHRFFGAQAWNATAASTCGDNTTSASTCTTQIGLDVWATQSETRTQAIERHLKSRVEGVLGRLCLGFVEGEKNGAFVENSPHYSREELDTIYRNAIYLLYRILFLFYAEARHLLPTENPRYARESLATLIGLAHARQTQGERDDDELSQWKRLTRLFVVVDDGDDELGVGAYNGGLFSDEEKPYLKSHRIADQFLSPALFDLAHEITKNGAQPIDYRDLSVRHLGTLYEGLLEYKLNLVTEPVVIRDNGGKRVFVPQSAAGTIKKGETVLGRGEVYFADDKGERKASGSYYTPEDVVQYIVSNTLGPKLKAIRDAFAGELESVQRERQHAAPHERQNAENYADARALDIVETQILGLKVLDPAMGSGHFLVAAGQMIANAIIELLNQSDWPNQNISSEPLQWKRRVVERCLYGVDRNPLAQELAKLSLWIASASRGKPLTFLDLHLKIGNSLLGTPLHRLAQLPPPLKSKKTKTTAANTRSGDLFAQMREEVIADLLKQMTQIAQHDSERIEDVKWKEKANRSVQQRAERLRGVCDVWLATRFDLGETIGDDEWNRLLQEVGVNYAPEQWQARVNGSQVLADAATIAQREKFFHWELEFADSTRNGACRFDCIVANPPYVGTKADAAISELYRTAPCGDLYAWLFERALQVLGEDGNIGTIVPLSLMFSRNFKTLRTAILERNVQARFANFDNNPDAIFEAAGAPRNRQRATITLLRGTDCAAQIWTTRLHFWTRADRPQLFPNIKYVNATEFSSDAGFPRLGDDQLAEFWRDVSARHQTIGEILDSADESTPKSFPLYLNTVAGYFITAWMECLKASKVNSFEFESEWTRDVAFLALNSNVFYWLWCVQGDGFDLTAGNVRAMILPDVVEGDAEVIRLRDALLGAAPDCATYQMKWGERIPNYNFNRRMDILLEIDAWLVRHIAPELGLPRDVFAQYKSNSFLRPLDFSALKQLDAGDDE